jgi:hypothetical protein
MVTHISERQTLFSYFDQLLGGPLWNGSKILDFGGNVSGFVVAFPRCNSASAVRL